MSYYKTDCCGRTTFYTRPTSAAISGGAVILTLPDTTIDIKNKDMIQFISSISLQELGATTEKVEFLINGQYLSVVDRLGNHIRADQLRLGKVFLTSISTDPIIAVMLTCTCKSTFIRSEVIAPTTTANSVATLSATKTKKTTKAKKVETTTEITE